VQSYTSDRRLPLLPWLLKDEERKERNLEKPRLHEDAMFALLLEILLMDNLPLRFYFMCHQHGARASVKTSGPQGAHLEHYAVAHSFFCYVVDSSVPLFQHSRADLERILDREDFPGRGYSTCGD